MELFGLGGFDMFQGIFFPSATLSWLFEGLLLKLDFNTYNLTTFTQK